MTICLAAVAVTICLAAVAVTICLAAVAVILFQVVQVQTGLIAVMV